MIKYAEYDIKDGLNNLRIGLGNILSAIAKGEIDKYILKTPLDINIIVPVLEGFDPTIKYKKMIEDSIIFQVNDKLIKVRKEGKYCVFFI